MTRFLLNTLVVAIIPAILVVGCGSKSGHGSDVPATHDCDAGYNSEWSYSDLRIEHSDLRICPIAKKHTEWVSTSFRVYDDGAVYPHPEMGDASFAITSIFDNPGRSDLLASNSVGFIWEQLGGSYRWTATAQAGWQRGLADDYAVIEIEFTQQPFRIAFAEITLTFHDGNDQ